MTPVDPYESRTIKWLRTHPKSATLCAIVVIAFIFGSIGIREWSKVSAGSADGSGIAKAVGIVAVALVVAWRANRRMRKH